MIDDEHFNVRFVFIGDSPFPFSHDLASITTNFDLSTLPTLSLSYHAFSLVPRFLNLTTLSHFHHAFSFPPRFLTLATLSHSHHAYLLLPRFLSHPIFFRTDHSPQFSAPTTTFISYHVFYLFYLSSPFSAAATTFIFHHGFSLQVFPHVQLRYQK